MLVVPAAFFYAATVAFIVVCVLLGVLLYFLIQATRSVLAVTKRVERGGKRVAGFVGGVRRVIGLAFTLFR